MITIKEAVIVEGRYDKIRLSSVVEGTIIETNGFRIFKDEQMRSYLKRLAGEVGVVILTDSDRAGFLIRNHIKSFLPPEQIKQAYIPEVKGVERRKRKPSKEGLLGVEGIDEAVLLRALQQAGCTLGDPQPNKMNLTKADLYADGLWGREQSADFRRELCRRLNLPGRLSAGDLLQALNRLVTRQEYDEMIFEITGEKSRSF